MADDTEPKIRGNVDPDREPMILREQIEGSLSGLMFQGLELAAVMTFDGKTTLVTTRISNGADWRRERFGKIVADQLRVAFAIARAEGVLEFPSVKPRQAAE